jgi:hypothetical protein
MAADLAGDGAHMQRSTLLTSAVGLVALVVFYTPSLAKERATVTVSYVVVPPKSVPEGLQAVGVIDAGVKTEGAKQDEREKKWSGIAADMIEAMLQNASSQFGANLAVAKRSQTKQILEEKDLRLAGLVEGADATRAGKLLAVQGLITSKLTINIDVQKSSKSTLDFAGIVGGVVGELNRGHGEVRPPPRVIRRGHAVVVDPRNPSAPPRVVPYLYSPSYHPASHSGGGMIGGGLGLKTREVEEISRSLTVQCSFCLVDAVTGQVIVQHSPPPIQKTDSKSPNFLFGGMMNQGDLDPVDHFIGELVEHATQEFVGMLVPVRVEETYNLTLSGKRGEAALRTIRADDYGTAMSQLQAALQEGEDKDGSLSFAAGVTCELTSKYDQALNYYRAAAASRKVDKDDLPMYLAAKQRLSAHIGRIKSPAELQPASPGAAPVPPAGGAQGAPAGSGAMAPAAPPPIRGNARKPSAAPVAAQPSPAAPANVEDEVKIIKELDSGKK